MSDYPPPPRRPLHERSHSQSNTQSSQTTSSSTIRLIPKTPPRLLGSGVPRDDVYSRTPLPTLPSHFLLPGGKGKVSAPAFSPVSDEAFQRAPKAQFSPPAIGSPDSTTHHGSELGTSATGSPFTKPKLPAKKRLHIHQDTGNKTFSLLKDDPVSPVSPQQDRTDEGAASPKAPSLSSLLLAQHKSSDSLFSQFSNAEPRLNSIGSCVPSFPASASHVPATPAPYKKEQPISADPIDSSPWNYQLVGGLRKVPKTPDLKQKSVITEESSPPPPLPQSSDGAPPVSVSVSHDLVTKPSFQSTATAETATTTSENTNYKVYGDNTSAANSDGALVHSSSGDSNYEILEKSSSGGSNYEILGSPSPTGSIIHRPQTAPSEIDNETYESYDDYGNSSSLTSPEYPQPTTKYSQESLVIPPLQPRPRRPNEGFGYYKSRSRETLRTGSLTSITTVLSQQEAYRAIVASGSLIHLPILANKVLKSRAEPSSWAQPAPALLAPPRSHMNEHPHVWSSQLSTVLSESDGDTDRGSGSGSWSENQGRRSSGFPSTQSRHSRQVLSISSSLAAEEAALARSRSDSLSLEPPSAAFARSGRQHSPSSVRYIGDQDEYGDGITDMQDLRTRPSRTRLNSYSVSTSDNTARTSTMRSTASSRANSLLAASIPTWARLYYGSGERRGLVAPGSSIYDGTDSRSNSFRSGSPNTDNFPLNIYSPRRRPREGLATQGQGRQRGSMEITPVQERDGQGRIIQERYSRRLRTWSMSSMWSPHLRHDRRAINRSPWVPPSVTWSSEGGAFGRRNIQVVMFVVGFIFPFAWMIAAFLPLPSNPIREMRERDNNSTSNLDSSNDNVNEYARHIKPMDEARYESARWWRQLNRIMSFIGLLIIGTIVTLVIVGVKQRW